MTYVSLHGRALGFDSETGALMSNGVQASAGLKTGTVTSAQMLALFATPVALVAAPGAGKALILEELQLWLDYNSAAYAGIASGEDLSVKYTDASGTALAGCEATGFLDATADAYRLLRPYRAASGVSDLTPTANAALVLHMLTGEITTGNSPLKYRCRYRVLDLVW